MSDPGVFRLSFYFEIHRRKLFNTYLASQPQLDAGFRCNPSAAEQRREARTAAPSLVRRKWTTRTAAGRSLGLGPRMASLGVGMHLIRRRAAGRSAAVERRNLLTVCRWGIPARLFSR